MKGSFLNVSLVALVLVAAAGVAEANKKQPESVIPVAQMDASQQEAAVRAFLASTKDLTKMKLPRLQQRLHRAETFRGLPNLPPDLVQGLEQEIARIAQEITSRENPAAKPPEPKIEDPPLPPYDPQKSQ